MIPPLSRNFPSWSRPNGCADLAQPIAIEDVIGYLMAALDLPTQGSRSSTRSAAAIERPIWT